MGARILKLAVMASVVFAASLATIKSRHDEGDTAHRAGGFYRRILNFHLALNGCYSFSAV